MYPPLTPSAGPRSRIGLILWFLLQWLLVPLDLLLRLVAVPFIAASDLLTDGAFDAEVLRVLFKPLTRWVGPARFAREWGTDQRRWDRHMNRLCDIALRAHRRHQQGGTGFRGWTYLRYGSQGNTLLISPKDYRGLTAERIHTIAGARGLAARSGGPFGITLAPATERRAAP
ncbi:hypothetical protein ACGFX4_21570 [Kitasatospora sp. NPDC048365]|uniref:hypothetical protein n=1 Tax=Kitasatospora sp. NPDC048365 TaxID=3364050 RepID=UPI00371119A1